MSTLRRGRETVCLRWLCSRSLSNMAIYNRLLARAALRQAVLECENMTSLRMAKLHGGSQLTTKDLRIGRGTIAACANVDARSLPASRRESYR